jgi:hypothetical protein
VFPLNLDTALNLIWLTLSVLLVGGIVWRDIRRKDETRPARLRNCLAIFVVGLTLFPSVSVSDDEISFWFLSHPASRGSMGIPVEETKEKATQQLARFLDVIETYHVTALWSFTLTLLLLAFVAAQAVLTTERTLLCRAGRSPPANLLHA